MSKEIISDELLRKAVARAIEIESAMYERKFALEKEHSFSGKYAEQMKGLLAELDEKNENTGMNFEAYHVSKKSVRIKILLIAAIVMLVGTVTVMADPVRSKISQFVEIVFDNHSDVGFTQPEDVEVDLSEYPKELKGIPEGYMLKSEDNALETSDTYYYLQIYENQNGHQIMFQQKLAESLVDNSWSITSDGTPAEEIKINGIEALILKDEVNYYSIIFQKDGFAYLIGGSESKEILIHCIRKTFAD